MKRYFKREAESDLGEGTVWFEFDGDWATRQVERYGDRWFRSDRASRDESGRPYHDEIGPALVDQPLEELELGDDDEIGAEEFEQAWQEAGRA